MAWHSRLKQVVDDSATFDTIKLVIEFYDRFTRDAFTEIHTMSVEDDFEVIREVVLKKLEIINRFRDKVNELKALIGRDIGLPPTISLGLKAEEPILKEAYGAVSLGLKAELPKLKEGL